MVREHGCQTLMNVGGMGSPRAERARRGSAHTDERGQCEASRRGAPVTARRAQGSGLAVHTGPWPA